MQDLDVHLCNCSVNEHEVTTPVVAVAAQRSAQELPQVEKSSLTSSGVSGGEEMVITGSNFFPESKVIFLEKGPGKCVFVCVCLHRRLYLILQTKKKRNMPSTCVKTSSFPFFSNVRGVNR